MASETLWEEYRQAADAAPLASQAAHVACPLQQRWDGILAKYQGKKARKDLGADHG